IHAASRSHGVSAEHSFFVAMSVVILAAVCVGFGRSFLLRPLFPGIHVPPERFFLLHGVLFLSWFVLLVVQSALVARRRVALHRSLGVVGGVLATTMVVLGLTGTVIAARRPGGFIDAPVPPLQAMAVPFFDMVLFSGLIGAAFALRRDLQSHKRLMLIGSIAISIAGVARWPLSILDAGPPVGFALSDLFLVPLVVRDAVTRRSLHPATLWGGLALVVSQPLRLVLSTTEPWLAFARWMTSLPG
ncbi:MAG: hypothetical protein ACXWK8_00130, partial [Myxococcaceae bacterium]